MRYSAVLLLLGPLALLANGQAANWAGNFAPCNRRAEVLKFEHMDVGVRLSTSSRVLAGEFKRALNFWATIVDMRWHEDPTPSCAIQLVDGTPDILTDATVARSQFADWRNFQGWIAFDPRAPLTKREMYLTSVHEIGHLLGLKHNANPDSVMYYLDLRGRELLDQSDLAALAVHHKLRLASMRTPIRVARRS